MDGWIDACMHAYCYILCKSNVLYIYIYVCMYDINIYIYICIHITIHSTSHHDEKANENK